MSAYIVLIIMNKIISIIVILATIMMLSGCVETTITDKEIYNIADISGVKCNEDLKNASNLKDRQLSEHSAISADLSEQSIQTARITCDHALNYFSTNQTQISNIKGKTWTLEKIQRLQKIQNALYSPLS